jgi:hypothetical protein
MLLSICASCLAAIAGAAGSIEGPTVLVWTGGGDGMSFGSTANWLGSPDGGSIDLSNLTEVYVIDDTTAEIGGTSGTSTLTFAGAGGIDMRAGRITRGAANQAVEAGFVFLSGGVIDRQWISNSNVRLEGTGRIVFSGANDPVPNGTIIDLGSMLCT